MEGPGRPWLSTLISFDIFRGIGRPRTYAEEGWWARQDSNLGPNRYERSALTN